MSDLSDSQASAFAAFEHQGWETVHAGYEAHFARLTRQSVADLLDAAEVSAGMRVLDVCCGPGVISAAAAERGAEVIGVDFSAAAIEIARAKAPRASFHKGDAQNLPFDDTSFDAVLCGFGIIHLPEPERALQEFRRVIGAGGKAAVSVWVAPAPDNGFGLLYGAINAHARLDVDLPSGPDFFQYSGPGALEQALLDAGFADCSSIVVPQFWDFEQPGDLLDAILEGAVRARGLLLEQSDEVRREIGKTVASGMQPWRNAEGGYRLPMPAIVGSARA